MQRKGFNRYESGFKRVEGDSYDIRVARDLFNRWSEKLVDKTKTCR